MDNKNIKIIDPKSVYIDENVEIGESSELGPNVILKGNTKIGKNVVIEGSAYIIDSEIGDNTIIKFSVRMESAKVSSDCMIGPFAHLRPGSELAEEVKVGNFVETKKSILSKGAKASHLSYLGDSEIGENVNIGAGTITCNYDGKNKFITKIKENAFIGSNSALVAPVTVGKDSLVGAGSVITKDIPDNSLALTRAELKIKNKK